MAEFSGKTVVITGAAGGIGLCLAHWFGARGAGIVGLDNEIGGRETGARGDHQERNDK